MASKPKVIFDIAMVGIGVADPSQRTGVYRYCSEIAAALAPRNDITLEFCATREFTQARRAIYQIDELRGVPLIQTSHAHLRQSLLPLLEGEKLSLPGRGEKLSRLDALLLKGSILALKKIVPKFAPPIAHQSLRDADVFHSPWFAFPKDLPKSRRLKRFLSVMDLIPIRFPYYFSAREDGDLRQKISRLNPDDHAICISSSTRDDLLNFHPRLDPRKVFVTYPGVSGKFRRINDQGAIDDAVSRMGIPRGARYLLSLCTLEPRKNLGLTIKAFSSLVGSGDADDLFLVLAGGEGWLMDQFFQDLKEAGPIKDRIILPGRIPDAELSALYSGAVAFVYPSLYEGFGLPPLEAMRCGTPVVVARTSSLPEVVGEAGLYCDPKDFESLAEALRRILNDRALAVELSDKGLRASEKFTWRACADATVAAYQVACA